MKKLYLFGILLIILLTPKSVLAQETQTAIRVGLNSSSFYGNGIKNANIRTGMHVGILYNYVIDDRITIQVGGLFSQKGAESTNNIESLRINYFDFPLVFKYYFNRSFSVHAGPNVGVLLNAKNADGNEINDYLKDYDIGAAIGTEYRLDFGLAFSLRYIAGLSSITEGPLDYSGNSEKLDIKNSTLQISTSYYFISSN